jgi:hypothetical protein
MEEDYGAVLKRFVKDGKWRNIEDVPEEHRNQYEYYKKLYPETKDLQMAAQRGGLMYRYMTSFGRDLRHNICD